MLLNNQWVTEKNQRGNQKILRDKWKQKRVDPNLWVTAKAVLRGKFIAIQSYLRKQEKSQINNLTLQLKQPEKEEKTKLQLSRRKETIKIRAEINELEMKKIIEKINETKSWFSEKINKIDKPLAWLIKKKGRGLKSIKLEMKKEKL